MEFAEFGKELILLEVELLELSLEDDIGEMELAILLVVILLLLFGFLIVFVRRMFKIFFGVENVDFFVLLLIHKVYVLNFYYRLGIYFCNSALMSIYSRIDPFYYVVLTRKIHIFFKKILSFEWEYFPFENKEAI